MAIAIPILMAATGAGAAIGAAVGISATMATMITSVAFSVTGISSKIDKAAASVFGDDLVKVADIFGAAYGAFTGGTFGFDGAGEAAGGLTELGEAGGYGYTQGTEEALQFGSLADRAGDAAGMDGSIMGDQSLSELGDAGGYGYAPNADSNVVEALNPSETAPTSQGGPIEQTRLTGRPASLIQGTGAASAQASTADAAGANAAGVQAAGANAAGANAAANVQAPGAAPPASQGFFGRLGGMVLDKNGQLTNAGGRLVGGLVQGVGSGYAAATKAKQEQAMFDAKMAEIRRMQSQSTGLRVTQ